jgi:peptidoglycan/xylan/chitin deacetylase (PgdA/CDA1 family)
VRKVLLAVAVAAIGYGLWALAEAPTYQLFGEIIPRVDTAHRVVALTFDDGPAPFVAETLETLQQKNVKATFFLNGSMVARYGDMTRRIIDDGHQVGNHTWSHKRMVFKSQSFIRSEIERTDAILREAGFRGEIHFRPPFGKKLVGLPWYLSRHGRKTITWDVEPESDPEIDGHTGRIVANVLAETRPGSIILLHPMWKGRGPTRAAVAPIIDGLRARGYSFVTVDQLLASQ